MKLKHRILIITLIALLAALTGCARRPVMSTETFEKKDSIVKTETTNTETSKAINEVIFIPVPLVKTIKPECDSVAQAALDDALSKLAYQKQSGDNRFELLYDKYNKLLTASSNIGATTNTAVEKSDFQQQSEKKDKATEVPVLFTPWYMKYPAYFGYFCLFLIICWIIKKVYSLWLPKVPYI